MKWLIKLFSLVWIFSLFPQYINAKAETIKPIVIDGNFDDWVGKPTIVDGVDPGNVPEKHNMVNMSYMSDDEYLYMRVKLVAKVDYQYDLQVMFYNGTKGEKTPHYPSYLDFEEMIMAQTFSITVSGGGGEWDPIKTDVKFNKQFVESGIFTSDDGSEVEFRLPLELVGLDGPNKEIQFSVKSNPYSDIKNIDWISDDGPIIDTTGPVFGGLTFFVVLGVILFVSYRYVCLSRERGRYRNC